MGRAEKAPNNTCPLRAGRAPTASRLDSGRSFETNCLHFTGCSERYLSSNVLALQRIRRRATPARSLSPWVGIQKEEAAAAARVGAPARAPRHLRTLKKEPQMAK